MGLTLGGSNHAVVAILRRTTSLLEPMRAVLPACVITLTCSFEPSQAIAPANLSEVARDCAMLTSKFHVSSKVGIVVSRESLTKALLSMHPVRVTAEEEGVYIATARASGHESGYFCLSNDTIAWQDWAKAFGWVLAGPRLYRFERRLPH